MTGAAHPGAVLGIARFYHDPRGSMRAMLRSGPTEGRLLAYAMLAIAMQLAVRLVEVIAAAAPGDDLVARTMEQVVSLIFFLPLIYYLVAALGTALARAFGGEGDWFLGRAAFFWAALVSAPVAALSRLAGLALGGGPDWLSGAVAQIGPVFFAWALAHTYAEAFGFASAFRVLASIALIALVPVGLVLAAGAL